MWSCGCLPLDMHVQSRYSGHEHTSQVVQEHLLCDDTVSIRAMVVEVVCVNGLVTIEQPSFVSSNAWAVGCGVASS